MIDDERDNLLKEIEELKAVNADQKSIISEQWRKLTLLHSDLVGLHAKHDELLRHLKTEHHTERLLDKINDLQSELTLKKAMIDKFPVGLSDKDKASLRVTRNDEINEINEEIEKLQTLLR